MCSQAFLFFVYTSSHLSSFTISLFSALNSLLYNFNFLLILQALFQGLARNTSLTWLDVSSNYLTGMEVNMGIAFDSTSMEEIGDSIGSNTTLECLDLSDNRYEHFPMLFLLCCQLLIQLVEESYPSTSILLNTINPVIYIVCTFKYIRTPSPYPPLYPHPEPYPSLTLTLTQNLTLTLPHP